MEIYIMRHGESVWNSKGIVQGDAATRLSKRGREQVFASVKKMKNLNIDLIICSPVMRTVQSANIVAKALGVKVKKDERLTELGQGIFIGRKYSSLSAEELQKKKERSAEYGMESLEHVHARVAEFLAYIKEKFSKYRLLIITHDGVASCIELCAEHKAFDRETYAGIRLLDNAEFKKVKI